MLEVCVIERIGFAWRGDDEFRDHSSRLLDDMHVLKCGETVLDSRALQDSLRVGCTRGSASRHSHLFETMKLRLAPRIVGGSTSVLRLKVYA